MYCYLFYYWCICFVFIILFAGGFHIIPGFKNHFVEWVTRNPHLKSRYGTRNTFIVFPELDPLNKVNYNILFI